MFPYLGGNVPWCKVNYPFTSRTSQNSPDLSPRSSRGYSGSGISIGIGGAEFFPWPRRIVGRLIRSGPGPSRGGRCSSG